MLTAYSSSSITRFEPANLLGRKGRSALKKHRTTAAKSRNGCPPASRAPPA